MSSINMSLGQLAYALLPIPLPLPEVAFGAPMKGSDGCVSGQLFGVFVAWISLHVASFLTSSWPAC